ncbi:MAG: TonB-dependent receptor [Endozoicomonas sp.]
MKKNKILSRSLLSAAVGAIISTQSFTLTAQELQLEEVVVTAQKRQQNLMDVPISIATKSGEELTSMFEAGADVRALSARVPGLYVESSNGRVAPRFYIRGMGNTDFDLAASQPVSVIMDEVVMENVILKSFPLFDIQQVEVLRGPQGTLFGRNTTAGIVKFDTRKPTFETEGYATLGVGQLGTRNIEMAIGGGLSESLAGRVSVLQQNRGDWINNAHTGKNDALGGFKETAARVQLLWEPSDQLSTLFNVHGRDLDGTSAVFRANILSPGSNDLNNNYDRDTVYFDGGDNNPQEYKSLGGSVKIDYDFDEVTLTSISAVETAEGSSLGDIDGGYATGPGAIRFPAQTKDELQDLKQYTQELRLSSSHTGSVQWQTGAYYFDSSFKVKTHPFLPAPVNVTVEHENKLWAVFGQTGIDLNDRWHLTTGLRYTSDEKEFEGTGGAKQDIDDKKVSGDIALSYALDDNSTVYARFANGFRGPTIQGRDLAFSGNVSQADSETVNSLELGYKAEFMDRRLRLNTALFTYEIKDMQFTAVGGASNNVQLLNANKGTASGFEMDLRWLVTDNLEVTAGYSYNDTEIKDPNLKVGTCFACTVTDATDGNGFALVDGNPFPNAPETTINFTARYGYPIEGGAELFAFTDWAYQGKTNLFLYESREFNTDGQYEGGLRLGYRKLDGSFEVALFGRNITDEENLQGGIDFNNLTGFTNEPRIWGVQLSTAF